MRALLLLSITTLACTFLGGCAADSTGAGTQAPPIPVHIKGMSYDPRKLEIHAGDAVVWVNDAHTVHTAMSEDPGHAFDTGDIDAAQTSKPVRFTSPGEYPYHCRVHGKAM